MNTDKTQETEDESFIISLPTEEKEDTNSEEITYNTFEWILDDDLLRDEGVYFGLTNSPKDEKIKVIEKFFVQQVELVRADISDLSEKIANAEKKIQEIQDGSVANKSEINSRLKNTQFQKHQFHKVLLSFLIFLAITVGNFFLIYDWTETSWSFPLITTIAVYCFGIAMLFNPMGLLFTNSTQVFSVSESREKWKVYLEEFGIPLIVTVFLITFGKSNATVFETLITGLLILTLFLFGGKALLSSISLLSTDYKIFSLNKKQKREDKKQIKKLEQEIVSGEVKQQELEQTCEGYHSELKNKEGNIRRLEALCITKIALFSSEYELSEAALDSLNDKQIANLLKEKSVA